VARDGKETVAREAGLGPRTRAPSRSGGAASAQVGFLLSLQQRLGNRAVRGLVQRSRSANAGGPGVLRFQGARTAEDEPVQEALAPVLSARVEPLSGPARNHTRPAAMVARALVQRQYEPTKKQKGDLKRWITIRWEQHVDDVDGISAKIAKWCSSHEQAELVGDLSYAQFEQLRGQFASADAAMAAHGTLDKAVSARPPVSTPQPQPTVKPVDPHAEAKRQLRKNKFDTADFTDDDLVLIEAGKAQPGVGWAQAIADVRSAKIERETSVRLSQERAIRYAGAKAIGESRFADALAKRVWAAAHTLAISGSSASSNPNITLSGDAVTREEALNAIAEWRANKTIVGGIVDNLHVPGSGAPIQHKARRETNPDPERGFQVDFCSFWRTTKVNVHVDVKTSSMTS
jgi:hypothetical protein